MQVVFDKPSAKRLLMISRYFYLSKRSNRKLCNIPEMLLKKIAAFKDKALIRIS